MATRGFHVIQDENTNVFYGGASFSKVTNDSKTTKKAGLGGSKALSNITNSGKPSCVNVLKKNFPMKGNDSFEGASVARQTRVPDTQKKATLSGRRALADISKSKKSSLQQASLARQSNVLHTKKKAGCSGRRALADISNSNKSCAHHAIKKTYSMKLEDITEEQFLHNHQECIDTLKSGLDLQSFFTALGFDDDFSVGLETPLALPKSNQPKAEFASPPRYLEYEDVPELLNEAQFAPQSETLDTIPSSSPTGYPSPKYELLMSP